MCAPPRFCTQLWALQRYFCLFVILNGLESTTLKPIYWFWASGVWLCDSWGHITSIYISKQFTMIEESGQGVLKVSAVIRDVQMNFELR